MGSGILHGVGRCRSGGVTVFIPTWSELQRYGGLPEMGMGPFPSRLRRNHDGSVAGIFVFSTNLLGKSQRRLAENR